MKHISNPDPNTPQAGPSAARNPLTTTAEQRGRAALALQPTVYCPPVRIDDCLKPTA